MCECITKVNRLLAEQNAELVTKTTIALDSDDFDYVLPMPLRKIDPTKRKPLTILLPNFRPFCGEQQVKQKPEGWHEEAQPVPVQAGLGL